MNEIYLIPIDEKQAVLARMASRWAKILRHTGPCVQRKMSNAASGCRRGPGVCALIECLRAGSRLSRTASHARACFLSPQIACVRHRSDLGAVGVAISRFEASAAIHDTDFCAEAPRLLACPGNDALLVLGAVNTPAGVGKVDVPLRTAAYDLKCFHVLGLVMALAVVYWQ